MSYRELFLELANPDENGCSRWVDVEEFTDDYQSLKLGNGLSWARAGSSLDKDFYIELDRSKSPGNRIDRIRLAGYKHNE